MALIGARPTGREWAPQLVISGLDAPAEQFIADPALPVLGQDPYIPNSDYVIIPRGRFLSVRNTATASVPAYANVNKPILTLATGSDNLTDTNNNSIDLKPMGFSEYQSFRTFPEQIQPFSGLTKNKLITTPYVQATNGAYGVLKPGDRVTAYYGTANGNSILYTEVGKPVKWVPRRYINNHAASATGAITLSAAILPAFKPTVIAAYTTGTWVQGGSTTMTYNTTSAAWQATFTGAVTDVLYHYGQDADNIAGEVISFEAVGTAGGVLSTGHQFPGWLDWVRDNFGVWAFPPLAIPRPYTNIVNETPTLISTGYYRLAKFPIVPANQISVTVTGTRIDPITGVSSTLTSSVLPLATSTYYTDYTYGADYQINPMTGELWINQDITVSSVTVSYAAETSYLDGKIYNPGQIGLTTGVFSGVAGTPAPLELAGVVADMHIMTI